MEANAPRFEQWMLPIAVAGACAGIVATARLEYAARDAAVTFELFGLVVAAGAAAIARRWVAVGVAILLAGVAAFNRGSPIHYVPNSLLFLFAPILIASGFATARAGEAISRRRVLALRIVAALICGCSALAFFLALALSGFSMEGPDPRAAALFGAGIVGSLAAGAFMFDLRRKRGAIIAASVAGGMLLAFSLIERGGLMDTLPWLAPLALAGWLGRLSPRQGEST